MMHVKKCFIPLGSPGVFQSVEVHPDPTPLGSHSQQDLSWEASTELAHRGGISLSEGLSPVSPVPVALHQAPSPCRRRCDKCWQFPALRTEFHGLVPAPCVQSMVFSSLAWLHRTSQLLNLCVASFWV